MLNPSFKLLAMLACLLIPLGVGAGCAKEPAQNTDTASSSADSLKPAGAPIGQLLKPRMTIPAVEVRTLDDVTVNIQDVIRDQDALLFFVQIGCESCEEVVEIWKGFSGQMPPDMMVIGIAEDEPDYVAEYARTSGFPFPLYCDPKGIFADDYKMNAYPSVIGIPADGLIAYVGKPVTTEFTPVKAWEMLSSVKWKRKKAGE